MLTYRSTTPTPVNGLDDRNCDGGPVYCGSFELSLNLSDRGRPVISVVMLPRQQGQALARDEQPVPISLGKQSAANRPDVSTSDLGLTGRQCDVLALMMQGKSNKGICRILDRAEPTVKNHVTAILKVFEVTNRTEAVIAARKLGWEFSGARGSEGSTTRGKSKASYSGCHVRAA